MNEAQAPLGYKGPVEYDRQPLGIDDDRHDHGFFKTTGVAYDKFGHPISPLSSVRDAPRPADRKAPKGGVVRK